MKSVVVGNCQSVLFAQLASRMRPDIEFRHIEAHSLGQDFNSMIDGADHAFLQPHIWEKLSDFNRARATVHKFPRCSFSGFHPDIFYLLKKDGSRVRSPVSLHSYIAFAGWWYGVPWQRTAELYNGEVFDQLGFDKYFEVTKNAFVKEWADCGLDGERAFSEWMKRPRPWMLTINHPRMSSMSTLVRMTLRRHGLKPEKIGPALPHNFLADLAVMPVYPDIAGKYGMEGSTEFLRNKQDGGDRTIPLRQFVALSYRYYSYLDKAEIETNRAHNATYEAFFEAEAARARRANKVAGSHPYKDIPSHQNWRKSFAGVPTDQVDPVVRCDFRIAPSDKVATAGSCFAQNLARALDGAGLNYYVTEKGDRAQGYGVYSARYGNVYTAEQLRQLIERAYGRYRPIDEAWPTKEGGFIDAFRPEMPLANNSREGIAADREKHFAAVREMIETMDYFVFTLGLTEAWRSRADGAVYPLAPGVAGGAMSDDYEFVNFDERDTYKSLVSAIVAIRKVNPKVKVILTVSPVPLMATYEPRHVLVSTTYSKAVLRVVSERATQEIENVFYFPSLEIITGGFSRGAYYQDDLRQVTGEGVDHVMRLFLKHGTTVNFDAADAQNEIAKANDIFCAEDKLDA